LFDFDLFTFQLGQNNTKNGNFLRKLAVLINVKVCADNQRALQGQKIKSGKND
jgi:hypothetical protein